MSKITEFVDYVKELATGNQGVGQEKARISERFAGLVADMRQCYEGLPDHVEHVRSDLGELRDALMAARRVEGADRARALLDDAHELVRTEMARLKRPLEIFEDAVQLHQNGLTVRQVADAILATARRVGYEVAETLNQDGRPRISFRDGRCIYFDGAVWQHQLPP